MQQACRVPKLDTPMLRTRPCRAARSAAPRPLLPEASLLRPTRLARCRKRSMRRHSQAEGDALLPPQASLADRRSDRTVVIVAHRLSTIMDADVIIVLKEGQVGWGVSVCRCVWGG